MKLGYAQINNFKGVKEAALNFVPPHETEPQWLHAVLGDNGSGKTTVLQAIALTLGLATRRVNALDKFPWYGFIPQRISTMGKTRVELQLWLDEEEVNITRMLFAEWRKHFEPAEARLVEPGKNKRLTLVLENGRVNCNEGFEGLAQFYGRFYAKQLATRRPDLKEWFGKIGDVFWYDQYRNLGKALAMSSSEDNKEIIPNPNLLGDSGSSGSFDSATRGYSGTSGFGVPFGPQGYPTDAPPTRILVRGRGTTASIPARLVDLSFI